MPRASGSVIDELRKASAPSQPAELREQAEIMLREMEALDLFAQGRHAEAFAMMDRAAALQAPMPKPIGRPFPVKDVDELYGELLLQANRAKEAITWFDRSLARTPNRSRAVLGLARAYRNSGDAANATRGLQEIPDELPAGGSGAAGSGELEALSSRAVRVQTSSILTCRT